MVAARATIRILFAPGCPLSEETCSHTSLGASIETTLFRARVSQF
jgi:hypothetical protein